jgi:hypothetical protein
MTTIEVFQVAAERGLKLGVEPPDTLTVQPTSLCSDYCVTMLRTHKYELLPLLGLRFIMVRSEVLGETIFFADDEATKTALVNAGAEPWSIYTRHELRLLIEQHRHEPITAAELLQIHRIRRGFNARVVE